MVEIDSSKAHKGAQPLGEDCLVEHARRGYDGVCVSLEPSLFTVAFEIF